MNSVYERTSKNYLYILSKLMKDKVVKDTDLRKVTGSGHNLQSLHNSIRTLRDYGFNIVSIKNFEKINGRRRGRGYVEHRYYYLKDSV